jgi:glycosyltransferase involved in cell wall biosynthesis
MACGVPVVTTAWAGASELVEPGQHGEVVPGDADASALARAILAWLVSERCEAARAGLRARAEEFGFERTLAQIESVLERAAAERALALRR